MSANWPYERMHEAAFDRQFDSCADGQPLRQFYTPQPVLLPPRPPCPRLLVCGRGAAHQGDCDASEPLELFFQPYSEQPKPIETQKAKPPMELLPKPRTENDANSLFFHWSKIGDTIIGKFINYEKEAGQFKKPELTLKTRDGKKLVGVPRDLRDRIEGPAEAGDLDGKWLRISFVGEKEIKGRENKMKEFKSECFDSEAQAMAQQGSAREAGQDDEEDPFEKHDRASGHR